MPTIQVANLRKVFRVGEEKIIALDDVSFTLEKGEITCILGTSGSGKTTLLNLMAGLEKPTRGSIIIHKHDIAKLNEKDLARFRRKHVGFVFQSYNLLPSLTALENVGLPLAFRGIKKRQREKEALAMLSSVGLKKHALHKPGQLSGGQQQRVAIARAFVIKPRVVFADEPTGNLDSKTSEEVMHLILDMAKSWQQNVIIVTHDQQIASYADKIIYISDGKISRIEDRAGRLDEIEE